MNSIANQLAIDKLINKDIFLQCSQEEDEINYLYNYFVKNNKPLEILINAINKVYNIEYINLKQKNISREILSGINNELSTKYNVYCIEKNVSDISLVTFKPFDDDIKNILITELYPLNIKFYFSFKNEIEEKIQEVLSNNNRQIRHVESVIPKKIDKNVDTENQSATIKVNQIINKAIELEASDIHIEPIGDKDKYIRVRFRIDGDLYTEDSNEVFINSKEYEQVIARIKILSNLNIAEKRKSQDGKISNIIVNGIEYDLRVSSMATIFGEKVVIRLIKKMTGEKDLSTLGFKEEEVTRIDRLLKKPNGILLTTGKTGSGKTTTLYTILNMLNNDSVNICTIEDPVESEVMGISQVQLNESAGITFPSTLRTFLRQDPDIIMVGEIRDLETGEIAIKAANTGHFVLSTVHTNNATATINRLISMGIEAYNISEGIIGIISQRLVKKLCPHCKKEYTLTQLEYNKIKTVLEKNHLGDISNYKFYENNPLGCPHCNKGFKGRTVISEVLEFNEKINLLISQKVSAVELREKILNDIDVFLPFEKSIFLRNEEISINALKEFL